MKLEVYKSLHDIFVQYYITSSRCAKILVMHYQFKDSRQLRDIIEGCERDKDIGIPVFWCHESINTKGLNDLTKGSLMDILVLTGINKDVIINKYRELCL